MSYRASGQLLPAAVIVELDNFIGVQSARILAARGVPVLGLASNVNHYCARTRVVRRVIASPTSGDGLIKTLERLAGELPPPGIAYLVACSDGAVLTISEHRDRIPVHWPDEAGEPVEADPRPPVQVGLERREREDACGVQADDVESEPPKPHVWRNALRPEALPLTDAENRKPEGGDRDRGRQRERDGRDENERGASGGGREARNSGSDFFTRRDARRAG